MKHVSIYDQNKQNKPKKGNTPKDREKQIR